MSLKRLRVHHVHALGPLPIQNTHFLLATEDTRTNVNKLSVNSAPLIPRELLKDASPFVLNVALDFVQLFTEKSAGFKTEHALLTGTEGDTQYSSSSPHCDLTWYRNRSAESPVVHHFHVAVLLDPKLTHDDVVNAARRVCPCVGLVVPGKSHTRISRDLRVPFTQTSLTT